MSNGERSDGVTKTTAAATTTRVYHFGASGLQAAIDRVEQVNRRAERNGLPGYTYSHDLVTLPLEDQPTLVRFTIHGEAPRFESWSFLAVIDQDPQAGPITRPIPGLDLDLSDFRARPGECDHCQARRDRKATYVVRHDDGTVKQVGSTCVEAFLGMKVSLAGVDRDPFEDIEDDAGRMRRVPEASPTDLVLAVAAAAADAYGFRTRRDAEGTNHLPTVAHVIRWIARDQMTRAQLAPRLADDRIREHAAAVRAWAREQAGSEFTVNLAALAAADYVSHRHIGTLVWAVRGYSDQRRKGAGSEWQGEPGGQISRPGTAVTFLYPKRELWTPTTLVLVEFTDPAGNKYVWSVAAEHVEHLNVGDKGTLAGKVKGHKTYTPRAGQPVKQTVVTYAELLP